MESINDKYKRIRSDVADIQRLYDFAERQYSYTNLRQPRKVSF